MKITHAKLGATLVAGSSYYGPLAHAPTYRPNGLDNWVLNLTVEGRGRINQGDELFYAEVGDVLLFPPRVRHDYSWEKKSGRWIHLWLYFSPQAQWAPLLNWPRRTGGVFGFALDNPDTRLKVKTAMQRCVEMFQSPLKNRLQFCANFLEEALLWCDTGNPFSSGSGSDDRIRAAVAYMVKHFPERLSTAQIAKVSNLSTSRFAHLFHENTGISPIRYLESLRIWKAQELLIGSSKSIKEISQQVGFQDPLYFSKVFRRNIKVSPRAFRMDSRRET